MKVELRVSWNGHRPGAVLLVEEELGIRLLRRRLATDKVHEGLKPVDLRPVVEESEEDDE